MREQRGRDLLLKVADIGEEGRFVTLAGLRVKQLSVNGRLVDITSTDSLRQLSDQLLVGPIGRTVISGSCLFNNAHAESIGKNLYSSGSLVRDGDYPTFQVVFPDFGTLHGPFQISGLALADERYGEATFEIALRSTGALAFTPNGGLLPLQIDHSSTDEASYTLDDLTAVMCVWEEFIEAHHRVQALDALPYQITLHNLLEEHGTPVVRRAHAVTAGKIVSDVWSELSGEEMVNAEGEPLRFDWDFTPVMMELIDWDQVLSPGYVPPVAEMAEAVRTRFRPNCSFSPALSSG